MKDAKGNWRIAVDAAGIPLTPHELNEIRATVMARRYPYAGIDISLTTALNDSMQSEDRNSQFLYVVDPRKKPKEF